MRHLLLLSFLLLPMVVTAQTSPPAASSSEPQSAPVVSPKAGATAATPATPSSAAPSKAQQSKAERTAPSTEAAAKTAAGTSARPEAPVRTEPERTASAPPEPPASTEAAAKSEPAATREADSSAAAQLETLAQPEPPARTGPQAGSGSSAGAAATAPQGVESKTSGAAPTKWPESPAKLKAVAKPPTVSKPKPRPRWRLRAAIKRKPPPEATRPRPIPINPAAPAKYAGTYRIDSWQTFEKKGLYHFFYLRPGGAFLLGAEWPGRESSRAAGDWQASGGRLSLRGTISVSTNKGSWKVPFRRSFRISVGERGILLEPRLEKNRFGLLGWPNAYYFFLTRISPNLPSKKIPRDAEKLDALIARLRNPGP